MNFEIIMLNNAKRILELVIYTTSDILPLYFSAKNKLLALDIDPATIKRIADNRKSEQYITFFAPQDGIISHLNSNEGEFVTPQNEILSLADLSSVWLEIELTEQQLAWVKPGDDVQVTISALPGHEYFAEVDFIYPFLDSKSNTAMARLTMNNSNHRLKPDMVADITISSNQPQSVLTVPKSAVIRLGNSDRVVWAMNPGEYKSINVELGHANDQYFEIISGLEPGDKVVTSAQFLLDSESSRASDLSSYEVKADKPAPSARTFGVIQAIEGDLITINRDAIAKWNRPAATVEFKLNDDSKPLKVKDKIDFTFIIQDGDFIVTEVHQLLNEVGHD